MADIEAIRRRHEEAEWTIGYDQVGVDRGALLAEVDRLTVEVDRLRDLVAYTGAALVNAGNSLAKSDGEVDRLTAALTAIAFDYECAGTAAMRERGECPCEVCAARAALRNKEGSDG